MVWWRECEGATGHAENLKHHIGQGLHVDGRRENTHDGKITSKKRVALATTDSWAIM